MTTYIAGAPVRLTFGFDVDGTATDPGNITLTVRKPDGTTLSKSLGAGQIVKDSTGQYHFDLTDSEAPALHGTWYYRVTSTTPAESAVEASFYVDASAVTSS